MIQFVCWKSYYPLTASAMPPKTKKPAAAPSPKVDIKRAAKSAAKKSAAPSTSPTNKPKRAKTDGPDTPIQWNVHPTQDQVNKLFGVPTTSPSPATEAADVSVAAASQVASQLTEAMCTEQDSSGSATLPHSHAATTLLQQCNTHGTQVTEHTHHTDDQHAVPVKVKLNTADTDTTAAPTVTDNESRVADPHPHIADTMKSTSGTGADAFAHTDRDTWEESRDKRLESLQELMDWPLDVLRKSWDAQDPSCRGTYSDFCGHLQDTLDSVTVSTAFSGIDTPVVSLAWLHAAVCHELGALTADEIPLPTFKNAWGVEWYSKSQNTLMASPHGPGCLYADMSEFWQPEIKSRVQTLLDQGQLADVMQRLLTTTDVNNIITPSAYCLTCGKQCEAT